MANNTRRISPRYAATLRAVQISFDHLGFAIFGIESRIQVHGLDMDFKETLTGWQVGCSKILLSGFTSDGQERIYRSGHGDIMSTHVTLVRHPMTDGFNYYSVEKVEMFCTCTSCGGNGGDGYHWVECGGICPSCNNGGIEHFVLTDDQGAFSGKYNHLSENDNADTAGVFAQS